MESASSDSELEWEEPMQSVQELVERRGIGEVPDAYVRPRRDRSTVHDGPGRLLDESEPLDPAGASSHHQHRHQHRHQQHQHRHLHLQHLGKLPADAAANDDLLRPPVIDFLGFDEMQMLTNCGAVAKVRAACEDWGFFQLVNHGLPPRLLARVRRVASQFFDLPLADKQVYANAPLALTGYGSRMGTSKPSILDWGDYFLHYVWPPESRDMDVIWPDRPPSYRSVMDEYSRAVHKLYRLLMSMLSVGLGLEAGYLEAAFGAGASHVLRINYYPRCPQPEVTLGLGSHSDVGGLTILLQDDEVAGLELKKGENWVLVEPIPNALAINIGDQLQIISNGRYRSVEHRAVVNRRRPRLTLAVFCNPADDTLVSAAPALLDELHPPLYRSMTFRDFLARFFRKGLDGKAYVELFRSSTSHPAP